MCKTGHFYMNEDTGVGILVTGSGKTAAGLSLMAVLSSGRYDYSDAYIVSVGCAGGNVDACTLGDVILVTAACDYDLGHHVDVNEREQTDTRVMWFGDDSYVDDEYEVMNYALYEKAYELIKDVPLQTTEQAKTVMADNFQRSGDAVLPSVKLGTALSGDNCRKGEYAMKQRNLSRSFTAVLIRIWPRRWKRLLSRTRPIALICGSGWSRCSRSILCRSFSAMTRGDSLTSIHSLCSAGKQIISCNSNAGRTDIYYGCSAWKVCRSDDGRTDL